MVYHLRNRNRTIAAIKITLYQLILSFMLVSVSFAYDGYSQEILSKRITIKVENQSIKKVLGEIEKNANVRFIYNPDLIKNGKKINLSLQNQTVAEVLSNVLTPLQLGYRVLGKQIVLNRIEPKASVLPEVLPDEPAVAVAETVIRGSVKDDKGDAIIGASVILKGTNKGTTTDVEGRFSLSLDNNDVTLIVSFIGYETQEIAAGNRTILDVVLKPDLKQLEEIVVVGYGEVKKTDLTGAVSSVQSKDIVRANPVMAAKAIQGQVAGATVTKTSNKPGAPYSITIRGENTINNSTAPLVVIDGLMGGDINNLNPNDIQSMDVLKDASSTAIYGARGANGVIIITTKKGTSGKPRVSYDSYVGVKLPAHIPKLMNSQQFYKATYTDRLAEGLTGATFTSEELANIKEGRTADWVDLITEPAMQMSQNISVSGGTEATTYRFSGGYLNENGNVLHTGYKRYNLNAGLDSKLGKYVKVGFTSYVNFSTQNVGSQESLRNAYRARPTGTAYYSDLANPTENGDFSIDGYAYWMGINDKQVPNPLADVDPKTSKLEYRNLTALGNVYAEITPLKGLSFRTSLSAAYKTDRNGDFRGQWSKSQIGNLPRAQYDHYINGNYTLDNILNYNLDLGKHKIAVTGLQSTYYVRDEAYRIAVKDLPYDSDWYALNTGAPTSITSSLSERTLLSFMGRINYTYNDKYLLTLTGRSDGASQLSEGNKWAFFPSVAVAWRLGDEQFIHDLNLFSNLKARVSYGQVGNSTVNPYSTQANLLNTGYDFDGTAAWGFAPANLANKNLKWERSKEYNIGLDFGFFQNRISASFEWYNRKTVDLILNQKIPAATGYTQVIGNVGQIGNKGIELTLNTVNIATSAFSWNSTFAFTRNRNKLLELYGDGQTVDKGNKLFVGHPIRLNYDYKFDGIWQTRDAEAAKKYNQVPGSVRVVDVNNDGLISSTDAIDDRVILGSQMPNWILGVTNRFKYKNFDLSFFLYYRDGVQYNNSSLSGTFGEIGSVRYNKLASLDYWRSDNPSNTYFGVVSSNPYRSAINYQDASFLRISDVTVGYTLPSKLMNSLKLNTARVYGQVMNPLIYSKFTGFDPEFNSQIYQDDVPSMAITVGVNLSF